MPITDMADVIPNTPPSCAETEPVTVATVAVVVIDPVVEDVGVSVPEMEDGTFSVPLIVESWTETVPVIEANETREPLTDTDWACTDPDSEAILERLPDVLVA